MPDNLEYTSRSEEVEEIINSNPDFFEKWGLFVFVVLLVMLGSVTWIIQYPDIVRARGQLISANGPKEIISNQSGFLVKLNVKEGQSVSKNDIIGWIGNSGEGQEIFSLEKLLDSGSALLVQGNPEKISRLFKDPFNNLGPVQTSFQEFATSLRQLDDYLTNGFYIKKKESILNDVKTFEKISNDLENERLLIIEDTLLSQHTFDMNEKLRKQSVISEEEYRTQRMKLLSKRMAIPRVNSNILNNENQRRTKLKELDQLNHDFSQQRTIFEQDLNTLKSKIRDWINNYSIIASTNGVVSFNQLLQQNQFLKQGSVLGYISPIQSDYLIQVYLPQFNLGKVDTGMNVLLRFDAYPYQELGFLRGKVNYISKIAQDSGYLATIRLTNGLVTNQKKEIVYRSGLKADALIITKNRRLLDRFLASVTKLTSK